MNVQLEKDLEEIETMKKIKKKNNHKKPPLIKAKKGLYRSSRLRAKAPKTTCQYLGVAIR
ncbi:MAG: hypothetical protein GXO88_08405 [Chlorobi bacterium]|nr:hypothetical protein [Chlorobiota bacterium]